MTTEQHPAPLRGIDADAMAQAGLLATGKTGRLTWPLSGSTDYIQTLAMKEALRLTYAETLSNGETTLRYSYDVPVERTRRHRGPDRVAFLCPLCKARVQTLYYVLPGGGFFLCEECQGMADEEGRRQGRPKVKRAYVRKKTLVLTPRSSDGEAFCCKCRDRREMIEPERIIMANGRPALRGRCMTCGTIATRIVGAP